ncbi:MAG: helix-turn-helix transcriptional regulator [Gemmatimonadota bacterium]
MDQRQLTGAMSALLSPLSYETRDDWFGAIAREIRPLFHGESTLIAYASGKSSGHFSADAPELARRVDCFTTSSEGEIHFDDEVMEGGMIDRRQRSLAVFTSALLDHLSGGQLRASPVYNDVSLRFGARITYALAVRGAEGEALLGVNAARPGRDPLSVETLTLLSLLAAPFQAGFEILHRLEAAKSAIAATMDLMSDGIAIYDGATGAELHRNPALVSLLAAEQEAGVVEERVRKLARSLCELAQFADGGSRGRRPLRTTPAFDDLRTSAARYMLRASLLPPSVFARERVVLVAVDRAGVSLPTAQALQNRFGLTPREAQVALRLALGDSDAKLARTLGVSPHTVRHHTEHVFDKLQVRSRKALAVWLASSSTR